MIQANFLVLAALLPLVACAGGEGGAAAPAPGAAQAAAPGCPRVAVLAEGASLTRYRPGAAPAPQAVEIEARLSRVQSRCEPAPRGAGLDVTLVVQATATRGPALAGAAAELPYWIAVTDEAEGRVLNRGSDVLAVSFAGGREAVAQGEEMMVRIPGDPARAAGRVILVGFQLTPAQMESNRRAGR